MTNWTRTVGSFTLYEFPGDPAPCVLEFRGRQCLFTSWGTDRATITEEDCVKVWWQMEVWKTFISLSQNFHEVAATVELNPPEETV